MVAALPGLAAFFIFMAVIPSLVARVYTWMKPSVAATPGHCMVPLFQDISKAKVALIGAVLVCCVGLIDSLLVAEISFSLFYVLPIGLVTWYAGRWSGVIVSLLSAATWLVADYLSGPPASHSLIPIWNMAVRLGFFLIVTWLLSELHEVQRKRRMLEKIFFHDLLNLVGSVRGFAELLKTDQVSGSREIYEMIYQAADRSVEEIEAQRLLASVDRSDIPLELTRVQVRMAMELATDIYRPHGAVSGKSIAIATDCGDLVFDIDQAILLRILGNMLKNAVEAALPGETVIFSSRMEEGKICFVVRNSAVIPADIRKHIFRQPVTSKGKSRGLGTYSIRLLTEYLQGEASFTSAEGTGTQFQVCFPLPKNP